MKSRAEKRQIREPKLTDGGEAFMPDDHSVGESSSTWGVVNIDSTDGADPTEELRVPSSKLPWAICELSSFLQLLRFTYNEYNSLRKRRANH
jgi:1-phosphatidylinositol-3-phosphate 5-kinase